MNRPIRVVLADRDPGFTESLGRYLDQQPHIKLVAVARDGQGAVDACREFMPDVALLDLHLPVLDTVRAIAAIIEHNQRVKVLALTENPEDRYTVEAVKAGASGCLEKSEQEDYHKIVSAIQNVLEGEVLISPRLASSILEEFQRISP